MSGKGHGGFLHSQLREQERILCGEVACCIAGLGWKDKHTTDQLWSDSIDSFVMHTSSYSMCDMYQPPSHTTSIPPPPLALLHHPQTSSSDGDPMIQTFCRLLPGIYLFREIAPSLPPSLARSSLPPSMARVTRTPTSVNPSL